MSRIEELIEQVRGLGPLPSEDDPDPLRICPPATHEELVAIEAACGGRLPRELRELLQVTAGFEHPSLEWKPSAGPAEPDGFGTLLKASDYGNGDGFGIEPDGDRCRVWWAGHDSWFLVYWSPSIEAFLELWLERARPIQGLERAQATQAEKDLQDAPWDPAHVSEPCTGAAAETDATLASFVESLPRGSVVHDLRRAAPGTEIPYERLETCVRGGSLHRRGLLLGFSPPPRPVFVEPLPVSAYAAEDLDDAERATLRALPTGALVLHQRDLPPGGKLDTGAYPDRNVGYRPPFHIIYPRRGWRFW
jgi:hypothetical protein